MDRFGPATNAHPVAHGLAFTGPVVASVVASLLLLKADRLRIESAVELEKAKLTAPTK